MKPSYTRDSRDSNEAQIVDALRAAGCRVEILRAPTDLLVAFKVRGPDGRSHWVQRLFEVKLPVGKQGGTRGSVLTDAQEAFFLRWPEPLRRVVRTPEEAVALVRRRIGDA